MFSTYSVEDYDRKNEDVDPMAASAEYELEKRVEKMSLFNVEFYKGIRNSVFKIIFYHLKREYKLYKDTKETCHELLV